MNKFYLQYILPVTLTLPHIRLNVHSCSIMSQADITAFVESASWRSTLTPEGVTTAITRGIPVSGQNMHGFTALHGATIYKRRELVVALLAAGADANVKNLDGETSVWVGAYDSTADILQLLINGGGSVNEVTNFGDTPLMAIMKYNRGEVAARLQILLASLELDLDARSDGKTAEEWAVSEGYPELAAAIAEERARRERWSVLRAAWIGATATSVVCRYK
jgi:ankyrin repeat protein